MEDILKLVITLIVLTITLNTVLPLLKSFNHYTAVRSFATDLKTIGETMGNLKLVANNGSWQMVTIKVPANYSVYFNNVTDKVEIHGEEELVINTSVDFIYGLNLSSGLHRVQLYYGELPFSELKNETVMFK